MTKKKETDKTTPIEECPPAEGGTTTDPDCGGKTGTLSYPKPQPT